MMRLGNPNEPRGGGRLSGWDAQRCHCSEGCPLRFPVAGLTIIVLLVLRYLASDFQEGLLDPIMK